jgi:SAM-dependent methyltransferase
MSNKKIQSWWSQNPMTYSDGQHGTTYYSDEEVTIGSQRFFDLADSRFYEWNNDLHLMNTPFGKLFPYESYRNMKVLEVGCGMGCMAMNWALKGAQVTAVDLNPVAIAQTRRRFELRGLSADISQADATRLPYADQSFDYVYSWGVLHHSPDLAKSLLEIIRVLKLGGQFGIMLYYRHSIMYWIYIKCFEGWLHGESLFLSPLELSSRYTDGYEIEGNPHTRPVSKREILRIMSPNVRALNFRLLGRDIDYQLQRAILIPNCNQLVPLGLRKALARRWGWSLWFNGTR